MFTINIYLRFALIGLFLGVGIILSFIISFWYSLPLILIGLVLLVGYVLMGTVQSAAVIMQSSDFAGANQRLNLTLNPNWLYSVNRAYYFMLKGTITSQQGDQDAAEQWLLKAQNAGLPSDNEKAVVLLQLANISALRSKLPQTQNYMRQIKDLKVTEAQIKEQIVQFEKALKQSGQAQMGKPGFGAMRPGGKRPRPKMR